MAKTLYNIRKKVWLVQSSDTGVLNVNMPYGGFNADFTVYKGLDNALEFYVRDLDRKAINLVGKTLAIRFIANDTGELVLTKDVTIVDPKRGLVVANLTKEDIYDWPQMYFRYAVMMRDVDTGTEHYLYPDQSKDSMGYITVSDSYIGSPSPVYEITQGDMQFIDGCYLSESWPGNTMYRFSEHLITVAITLTNFTGTVTLQASLEEMPSSWFDVELDETDEDTGIYQECTGTEAFSIEGNYRWLRVRVCPAGNNTGTFDKLSIRI